MDHRLLDLHSNPRWSNTEIEKLSEKTSSISPIMLGKHYILELYDCDKNKLNDEALIRTTITSAAKISGATLINLMIHRFIPQGVTALALLAESHISIHTWPEKGYGAVDVFTCGDHTMPERACDVFIKELLAEKHLLKKIQRQTPKGLSSVFRHPNS